MSPADAVAIMKHCDGADDSEHNLGLMLIIDRATTAAGSPSQIKTEKEMQSMDFNQPGVNDQRQFGNGYFQNTGYGQPRPGAAQESPLESVFSSPGGLQGSRMPGSGGRSLSREERMEAKRLMEEANFGFEGYQVVRREFMSHQFDPAMTIRGNSITFNNACISKLEDATYIQFLINPTQMKLVIRACSEGARDAVRWCITKNDKRKSRQITCGIFTAKLYEMMGWDGQYRYKLQGMRITHQGEPLYLFDLNANEAFLPQSRDPETGKVRRAKPVLPVEWRDSFGMSVQDHEASTQINLREGFVEANRQEDGGGQSRNGGDSQETAYDQPAGNGEVSE